MVRIVDRIDEAIPAVRIELTAMERESEEEGESEGWGGG